MSHVVPSTTPMFWEEDLPYLAIGCVHDNCWAVHIELNDILRLSIVLASWW